MTTSKKKHVAAPSGVVPDAAVAGGGAAGVVETVVDDVEALLTKQLDELEDLVREHPLATVAIAAGIGLAAGLLLSTGGRR